MVDVKLHGARQWIGPRRSSWATALNPLAIEFSHAGGWNGAVAIHQQLRGPGWWTAPAVMDGRRVSSARLIVGPSTRPDFVSVSDTGAWTRVGWPTISSRHRSSVTQLLTLRPFSTSVVRRRHGIETSNPLAARISPLFRSAGDRRRRSRCNRRNDCAVDHFGSRADYPATTIVGDSRDLVVPASSTVISISLGTAYYRRRSTTWNWSGDL